jgi:transcriptional regulator with XRE-family HTH domain
MRNDDLIETESSEVGQRVREEIARRRLSRQALADMAKISLSTLEKALAGTRPFTLATTLRIEAALGLMLRPSAAAAAIAPAPDIAPENMGAYARSAVGWVEGRYLTLRPSFGTPNAVYACVTTIRWLDEQGHLAFAESERVDARFERTVDPGDLPGRSAQTGRERDTRDGHDRARYCGTRNLPRHARPCDRRRLRAVPHTRRTAYQLLKPDARRIPGTALHGS